VECLDVVEVVYGCGVVKTKRRGVSAWVLNFPFVQYDSERFLASVAVEEADFKLHSFAHFVWSSSHFPLFPQ